LINQKILGTKIASTMKFPLEKAKRDLLYGGRPNKYTIATEGHNNLMQNTINQANTLQENYDGRMPKFHIIRHLLIMEMHQLK